MWFRVDSSNHLGFAHRFLQWEIDNFCPCSLRSTWPAFSLSGADVPLKPEPVRAWHKKLVTHVMGPERAKLRTWHALRATLASAIAAYRGSDNKPLENYEGVAQMMVLQGRRPWGSGGDGQASSATRDPGGGASFPRQESRYRRALRPWHGCRHA